MEILSRDRELTIMVDKATQQNIAATMDQMPDVRASLTLTANGTTVELPADVSRIIMNVLENLSQGSRVVLASTPKELRTTAAAEMLGCSRPTLLKLIRDGQIPSHKVGSHHRLLLSDVLEYRAAQQRAKRQQFLDMRDELADLSQ